MYVAVLLKSFYWILLKIYDMIEADYKGKWKNFHILSALSMRIPMDCKKFEGLIPEFVDKKLDYATTKLFLEHIKSCGQCKEELNIQFLVNEGLIRLEEGEAFDLQQEMQELLGQARKKVRMHERILKHGRFMEGIIMLAIAGVIAAILLF